MTFTLKLVLALIFVVAAASVSAQDPVKLSPTMYTVLLENDQVRVLEFRCKAGEKEPMHFHPAAVAYSVSAGKYRMTTKDGKVTEGDSKPGTTVWVDPGTHSFECLGPGEQRTIITELKTTRKP